MNFLESDYLCDPRLLETTFAAAASFHAIRAIAVSFAVRSPARSCADESLR
jgi:hypothetical protein